MTTQKTNELNKSATRHFYAIKQDDNKGAVPYVFEKIAQRNTWLEKYGEVAKPVSATEAYRILQKSRRAILAANRTNRVYVVDSVDAIDTAKGHRLILS